MKWSLKGQRWENMRNSSFLANWTFKIFESLCLYPVFISVFGFYQDFFVQIGVL